MVDRELLLADLLRLGSQHKDYSGTVERVDDYSFRLRYHAKPDDALIEVHRVVWNEGVRALDAIAPRVIQFANEYGILMPAAETEGATVMAWVLQERFPANRVSASALTNAFDAIRETILCLVTPDFTDMAIQRLHQHDKFEERVRQEELQASEAHRVQREKLKDACRRLKEAINAYNAAHHDRNISGTANVHLARELIETLAVIDELGLGPTLDANAQRKDKQLLSSQLEDTQIGYIKDELRLHLLLIKCRNRTEEEITELLDAMGHLSPSSCDDLWIDLWHYDQFTDVVEEARLDKLVEQGGAEDPSVSPEDRPNSPAAVSPVPFSGGELVFYEDRVKLCCVDICSGKGSKSKRIVLELLSERRTDGEFMAYSLEELQRAVSERGGRGTANGLVRDLRDNITDRLFAKANIACNRMEVILSRGGGYRFSEKLSVQWADPPIHVKGNDNSGTAGKENATVVGDGGDDVGGETDSDGDDVGGETDSVGDGVGNDVASVGGETASDGDDVGDCVADDGDDGGSEVAARKAWILEELRMGIKLKVTAVANYFNCSRRTAERALNALKNQGLIEYVGNTRAGYYRLVQSPEK